MTSLKVTNIDETTISAHSLIDHPRNTVTRKITVSVWGKTCPWRELMRNRFIKVLILALSFFMAPSPAATFDVRAFGAQGNGSSNDSAAVQNALNACDSTRDRVYFPPGTYMLDELTFNNNCREIFGERDESILKGRTNGQFSILFNPGLSSRQTIRDLVFDNNGNSLAGVKFDATVSGLIIRFCRFRGGATGINIISGSDGSTSSIDHNIFEGLGLGINSFSKLSDMHMDRNYFRFFHQGIAAGGCSDTPVGSNTTVDHNTFLFGQRIAIEFCGRWDNVSASNNYLGEWQPSANPSGENYPACFGSFPFMCDSMGISLSIRGFSVVASHNRMYRQEGVSWGIEYAVQGNRSAAEDNEIKGSSIAIVDEDCNFLGNCAVIRNRIRNNSACGGRVTNQQNAFANWDSSNDYYPVCPGGMPREDPEPAPPFGPRMSSNFPTLRPQAPASPSRSDKLAALQPRRKIAAKER